MKFIKFIAVRRLNYFDVFFCAFAQAATLDGHYLIGVVTIMVGVCLSLWLVRIARVV